MSRIGYIYALENESYGSGIIKVGKTTNIPSKRAEELSRATGVPSPFDIVCSIVVSDVDEAEKFIHNLLGPYRVNNQREFFKIDYVSLKHAMKETAYKFGSEKIKVLEKELNNLEEAKILIEESIERIWECFSTVFEYESEKFKKACERDTVTVEFSLDIPRKIYDYLQSQNIDIDLETIKALKEKHKDVSTN